MHIRYCGTCGTEVEGFQQVQEGLQRMEGFRAEKKWSRVLKEHGLLPQARLTGVKGKAALKRALELKGEADRAIAQTGQLKTEIEQGLGAGKFEETLKLVEQYAELDPNHAEINALIQELPKRFDERDWVAAADLAARMEADSLTTKALAAFRSYSEIHPGGAHAVESTAAMARLGARLTEVDRHLALATDALKSDRLEDAESALVAANGLDRLRQDLETQLNQVREKLKHWRQYRLQAKAAFDTGAFMQASALWTKGALAIRPKDADAAEQNMQAIAARVAELSTDAERLLAGKQFAEAAKQLEVALQLIPGDGDLKGRLCFVRLTIKHVDKLLDAARKAFETSEWRRCLENCRAVLALQGENASALALMREAGAGAKRARIKRMVVTVLVTVVVVASCVGIRQTIQSRNNQLVSRAYELATAGRYAEALKQFDGCRTVPAILIWAPHPNREWVVAAQAQAVAQAAAQAEAARQEEAVRQAEMQKQALTIADLGMTLQPVAAGEFQMGSNDSDGESDEKPAHRVQITRPFWIGRTEVTQRQWELVMRNNPSNFKGADNPVESVDWNACVEFCRKLTQREQAAGRLPSGYTYRLPTEAQWEYACRAGTTTRFNSGDADAALDQAGWYSSNSGSTTHPGGQKAANAFGLHDMHGNVWEWCQDWYGPYDGAVATDPTGPSSGSYRVLRGGSWGYAPGICRSAYRDCRDPAVHAQLHRFSGGVLSLRA